MSKSEREPLYMFEVSHPDYPAVVVAASEAAGATVEAARRWDVPELWGRIAGYCTVKKGGTARKPRYRSCGKEYGLPGQEEGLCAACRHMQAVRRREAGHGKEDARPAIKRYRIMDKERAMELYREGKNDREIAEAIGASNMGVWRWRQREGLPAHRTSTQKEEPSDERQRKRGDTGD